MGFQSQQGEGLGRGSSICLSWRGLVDFKLFCYFTRFSEFWLSEFLNKFSLRDVLMSHFWCVFCLEGETETAEHTLQC